MRLFLIAYAASLLAFLVIDGVWLGLLARNFYADQMGELLRVDKLWLPALAFYLMYSAGVVVLVVRPWLGAQPLGQVAVMGAVLGFVAYGTYNFTNLATVRGWPQLMSMVDLVWGTILTASVAVATALAVRHFE